MILTDGSHNALTLPGASFLVCMLSHDSHRLLAAFWAESNIMPVSVPSMRSIVKPLLARMHVPVTSRERSVSSCSVFDSAIRDATAKEI